MSYSAFEKHAPRITWRDRLKLIGIPMQTLTDYSKDHKTIMYFKERKGVLYMLREKRIPLSTFVLLDAAKRFEFPRKNSISFLDTYEGEWIE